jgi:hypothetical protein
VALRPRAPLVVTLDDGQNNPAFIPALLRALEQGGPRVGLIAGQGFGVFVYLRNLNFVLRERRALT